MKTIRHLILLSGLMLGAWNADCKNIVSSCTPQYEESFSASSDCITEQDVRTYLTNQGYCCIGQVWPEPGTTNWLADTSELFPRTTRVFVVNCEITGHENIP